MFTMVQLTQQINNLQDKIEYYNELIELSERDYEGTLFTNEEKKAVYGSDIVYTTHGAFGFDYLLNKFHYIWNQSLSNYYLVAQFGN